MHRPTVSQLAVTGLVPLQMPEISVIRSDIMHYYIGLDVGIAAVEIGAVRIACVRIGNRNCIP